MGSVPSPTASRRFFVTYAAVPSFHAHSVALFAMYYNFVRIHKTLRTPPAMAADVTKRLWEIDDIVDVLDRGKQLHDE